MKSLRHTQEVSHVDTAVAGMRRVDYVRMVEDTEPRFFVVGVGHRCPVEREVSAGVARVLLAEVPCHHEWRRIARAGV